MLASGPPLLTSGSLLSHLLCFRGLLYCYIFLFLIHSPIVLQLCREYAACFHVFSHWRHLPPATAMIATLLLSRQGRSTSPAKQIQLAWRCHMKAWSVFLLFSTRGDQNLVVQEEASSTTKLRATRTSPRKDFAATMDDEIYDRASLGSTSSVNKIIHPDVQASKHAKLACLAHVLRHNVSTWHRA